MTNATLDVLEVLLQAREQKINVHGWLIMRSTRRSGKVVYDVLDRLEDAGWVIGSWETLPPGLARPRLRFYQLTAPGVEAAHANRFVPHTQPLPRLRPQPGFGRTASLRPTG